MASQSLAGSGGGAGAPAVVSPASLTNNALLRIAHPHYRSPLLETWLPWGILRTGWIINVHVSGSDVLSRKAKE